MNILTTYRSLSPQAIEDRGLTQLMQDRIELGEARDSGLATMQRLNSLTNDGKTLGTGQLAEFKRAEADTRAAGPLFEQVDTLVRSMESAARAEATGQTTGSTSSEGYAEGRPLTRAQSFSGYVRSRGFATDDDKLDLGKYLRGVVTGDWSHADAERRAMAEGTDSAGGYMVPVALSSELIDLARNQAAVMRAGARTLPMDTNKITVAKWAGDASSAWHAENDEIVPSDATLGGVVLDAQTLAAITKVSRELIEDATDLEGALKAAFASQFALELDRVALYGTGTSPEPRGIKSTTTVTKTPLGTNGAAATWDDLIDAVGALEDANEHPTAQILAPRTARGLAKLKDGTTGQYIAPPTFLDDVPRYSTNQVRTDLTVGTGTNTSDIFTGDFEQLLIGLRTSLKITVLQERYADTGELGFVSWFRGDVAVARAAAFDVRTGAL